jgi:hypothetical protein
MKNMLPPAPGQYEDEAIQHQKAGRWEEAAKSWTSAAEVSLGRGRKSRYLENAEFCRKQLNWEQATK